MVVFKISDNKNQNVMQVNIEIENYTDKSKSRLLSVYRFRPTKNYPIATLSLLHNQRS